MTCFLKIIELFHGVKSTKHPSTIRLIKYLTIVSLHNSPQKQSGYFSVLQKAFLTTSENPSTVRVLSKSKYTFLTGVFASDIHPNEGMPPFATQVATAKIMVWEKRQTGFIVSTEMKIKNVSLLHLKCQINITLIV